MKLEIVDAGLEKSAPSHSEAIQRKVIIVDDLKSNRRQRPLSMYSL